MTHSINPIPPMPALVRPRPRAATQDDDGKLDKPAQHAVPHKSAATTSLEMADDLSALASSLRRLRQDESQAEHAGAWVERVLEEHAADKMVELKQAVFGMSPPRAADIRVILSRLFPDPSDRVLVLRALLDDESVLEELRHELDLLLTEADGKDGRKTVRGGINVALKAKLRAHTLGATAKQLRSSYREFLDANLEAIGFYDLWIEEYGFERRFDVIDFIEQALAADMYALDPSCSRLEFGNLLKVVRRLTTLRSADNLLMKHCWRESLMKRMNVTQQALLQSLLGVIRVGGGFPDLFKTVLAGARFGLTVQETTGLAQGFRRAIKALPHDVWFDVAFQLQALDEVEQLIDGGIAAETRASGSAGRVNA
jgi:type III secretion system YopN/LcrE/InvE/MxiC family regulator